MNDALVRAWLTPNSRTRIIVPFQHGKSLLGSIYFPAWILLLWPETRIALGSYETSFASNFGGRVRDVINRYGPAMDIYLRDDTKAKGEWALAEHGGGMICKGRGAALVGRPADILILDDMIKGAQEAQSAVILEGLWEWYQTVAYSRLGPRAPIVHIGTRWCARDLHGRLEQEEKVGGEHFDTVHFKAIAEGDDPLEREEGQALWPERVPLSRLQRIQRTRPRWFRACWQGEPMEVQGMHYQTDSWPRYTDIGDAWRVKVGVQWNNYRKADCTILIALDWAQKAKKDSDKTAFVVAALTQDGLLLILHVFNQRLRYEENAPALQELCEEYNCLEREVFKINDRSDAPEGMIEQVAELDMIVASDDDMLSDAMVVECRRYSGIPEIRRLGIKGRNKLIRAQASIIRGQNGLILMPEVEEDWYQEMDEQLRTFTGEEGAEDDIVDCFGILGRLADEFVPGTEEDGYESSLGSDGWSGMEGWSLG